MKIWVFLDGRQQGPFEIEELLDMPVNPNTKVWFEGLPKWYPAGELPELRALFDGSLPEPTETTVTAEQFQQVELQQPATAEQPQHPEPAPEPARFAPGQPFRAKTPEEPCPPTYIGWAVFLLVCCCSPVSLAAIITSISTGSFYHNGKIDKARRASDITAWLIMISIALGFIPVMLMSVLFGN